MAQASALGRSGKRAADAGASVHRVIRPRSAVNNSAGGAGGSSHVALAPTAAKGSSNSAAAGSQQQAGAAPAGPSQVLPWAVGQAAAGAAAQQQFTLTGCALGTPASHDSSASASTLLAAGVDASGVQQQQQQQAVPTPVAVDGSRSDTPVLGVPTFPSMALAAAKAGCFGMPFGMMPPPPFFMFMMQRQMAMMQQAMHASSSAMAMMNGMMSSNPFAQQQQQQVPGVGAGAGMPIGGGADPAMMQAAGSGMPCYPPLAGASAVVGAGAGGWAATASSMGMGTTGADQASGAKPAALGVSGFAPASHRPLLPSLDMAAVVSALAEARQLSHGGEDSATTTTTTRSSAGGGGGADVGVAADGALLTRSDTHDSHGGRPCSSADTLTGGGGGAHTHHQGGRLFEDEEDAQLTDLEFNSFIDSFLLSGGALAGSSGALDAMAAGGAGAGIGSGASTDALGAMLLMDPALPTGDAALDLHLPLAELLPELAMEPTPPVAPAPTTVTTTRPRALPTATEAVGGALPLGLALEPQSVLERLSHLVGGADAGGAAAGGGDSAALATALA